jgi:hypothetical protein
VLALHLLERVLLFLPVRHRGNCFGTLELDGTKCVGEWKDNQVHGQGTYTFADGNKYVGGLKEYQMHGQGTMTSARGDKYVGEWKDGTKHGEGALTLASDRECLGDWKFNKPWNTVAFDASGKFVYSYKNGVPQDS